MELKSLAKDTAIYGLSSIVGRFLNYLLVPLYTAKLSAASGGYGVITHLYALTALMMVLLTYGMETTFFRFANKEGEDPRRVYATVLTSVLTTSVLFVILLALFLHPAASALGYAAHPQYVLVMGATVAIDAFSAIPFCYLRQQKKAIKFALLKLFNILLTIALNLLFFVVFDVRDAGYAFYINLACSALLLLCLSKELLGLRYRPDGALLRRMWSYSWPILIFGIAGILNQTADKILFPFTYHQADSQVQLGIYGAASKIAMIMAMITQAFRYAYEPFVFGKSREEDHRQTYAQAMKYFLIFTLLAFLVVVGYLDVLKYLIGRDYWSGLRVVPVVMTAEIMMGIYFNLSFWYKLVDKTIWGAWFSGAGCAVLILFNIIFVPRFGYMACAWGGVAGYATAMVLSYVVGQRKYPIRYPLRSMGVYVVLTVIFTSVMYLIPKQWPVILRLILNTGLILLFVGHLVYHDLPLHSLPVVGKYFQKRP